MTSNVALFRRKTLNGFPFGRSLLVGGSPNCGEEWGPVGFSSRRCTNQRTAGRVRRKRAKMLPIKASKLGELVWSFLDQTWNHQLSRLPSWN